MYRRDHVSAGRKAVDRDLVGHGAQRRALVLCGGMGQGFRKEGMPKLDLWELT